MAPALVFEFIGTGFFVFLSELIRASANIPSGLRPVTTGGCLAALTFSGGECLSFTCVF